MLGWLKLAGDPVAPVTVTFTTEKEPAQAVTDTPITISVRVVRPDGSPEALLVSANVQLLDDTGKPAQYGGHELGPSAMRAGPEPGFWVASGSVPSVAGNYHARVEWQALPANDATPTSMTQTLELEQPRLTAVKDNGAPLTSGYVFARDANLWIMSSDTTRQRRLTFYEPFYEYADNPAWSPDGKTLAYAYSPKVAANEIPATDIWLMNADGTGAKQIVAHGQDESVYEPSWSPDGKSLYYTVEKSAMSSTAYDASGSPVGQRLIEKVDLTSGARTQWAPFATMPSCCDKSGRLAYLEDLPSNDPSGAIPPGQQLMLSDPQGASSKVLVNDRAFQMMYAPSISPDGKWVAFGAINSPPPQSKLRFDFFRWLLFMPETASAHGLPWDLYMVPTSGGQPIRLTTLDEDQPFAIWLDNTNIAFMGVRGLYKVQIGTDGQPTGQAQKVHDGAPHGGLTWHAP